MMRAEMASISAACSGVKNSNFGAAAERTAWRAWSTAARASGQCVATQVAETAPTLLKRNCRRESASCTRRSFRGCTELYNSSQEGSREKVVGKPKTEIGLVANFRVAR